MSRKLLGTLLALATLAGAPAAHAAQPGVNIAGAPSAHDLDVARDLGARTVRTFLYWNDLEPTQGSINASGWAAIAGAAAARGMKMTFVVLGTPPWANGGQPITVPPSDPATMASFVERFAKTAGVKGNVAGYEIWNEQDEEQFWTQDAAGRPATYAALVNAVGPAIKRGDPAATVILGPTTGNNYGFLQRLYDAGISKSAFDAIGVHTDTACLDRGPYSFYRDNGRLAQYTFLGYREMRATALANGDDKPIWMTELGWTTTGDLVCGRGLWAGQKPAGVDQAEQAAFLKQAFNCMAEDPYVQVAQWFTMRDNPSAPIAELQHYGLLTSGGAPKPAFAAFQQIAGAPGHDILDEACGDFAGPTVRIHAPTAGQRFAGALTIRASAIDPSGVGRITFRVDDRPEEIRNFTTGLADGAPVELQWQGAKTLPDGPHKITVEAVDPQGNIGRSVVEVVKAPAGSIASTIRTQVKLGRKLRCKGRTCTLTGRAGVL
ncbi:MAG TPA: Ig-like domain-containing protein, partial [Baekduia sp.]|nr:Ig-like domain-containing protein [Baekduia sp.]